MQLLRKSSGNLWRRQEHQVEEKTRFTPKRKNCRIQEQGSDSEGVLGGTAASSRHYVEVCAQGKLKRCLHGKDIRNSEELKSQKQKQRQYQKSMDQTLNAKMMDENNGTFSNTALSSTNSGQLLQQGRSATCEDGQGGDPEVTTTVRKNVIINEYESDKASPNDTILTTTPFESNRKGRM